MSKYLTTCLAAAIGFSVVFSNAVFSKDISSAATNAQSKEKQEKFIFMCDDFAKKIQNCEAYTCQVTLGGITTVTQIQGKKEGRCVVATITGASIGLKKQGNANESKSVKTPISTICEYDQDGIEGLTNKFEAMKHGNFDFSSKQIQKGEFNCITSALGQTFPTPKDSNRY